MMVSAWRVALEVRTYWIESFVGEAWRGENAMQSVFQSDAGVRHSIANHSFDGNQRSTHNSVSSLLNRCCSSLSVRWMIKQRNSTLLYSRAENRCFVPEFVAYTRAGCWEFRWCSALLKLLYNQFTDEMRFIPLTWECHPVWKYAP